ncbi:hypothetical protein EGW08_023377, partial [Elysia chlorotica]
MNGDVSFNRSFSEYSEGFGSYAGDFFLGLRKIHKLTRAGNAELEISINDEGREYNLYVKGFVVASEPYNFHYKYSGTFGGPLSSDAFIRSSLAPGFSTYDSDNDQLPGFDCANDNKGAWWYTDCGWANLFGPWRTTEKRMFWYNGDFT